MAAFKQLHGCKIQIACTIMILEDGKRKSSHLRMAQNSRGKKGVHNAQK